MEDTFADTRSRWQRSYRHPLYLRFLWVVGVAIAAAAIYWRARIRGVMVADARIGWAVVAGIGLLTFICFWASFRAWQCKILVSPTAIKAWYLLQGRERISWDHMDRVIYKWRLPGHALILVGSDGARVRIGSAISRYDEILDFIRANAPKHIAEQLDEIFGTEEVEEDAEQPDQEASNDEQEEPDRDEDQQEKEHDPSS